MIKVMPCTTPLFGATYEGKSCVKLQSHGHNHNTQRRPKIATCGSVSQSAAYGDSWDDSDWSIFSDMLAPVTSV